MIRRWSVRVVSLPSATGTICALGASQELVGVSHACDHPPQVAGLPAVTRSRLPGGGPSGALDRSVRELLRAALAIYDLDVELLAELGPELVVTQDLEVCAVSYGAVCAAVDQLAVREVAVVSLHPERLDDIWGDICRVASALDHRAGVEVLLAGLLGRLGAGGAAGRGAAGRPRVVTVEWLEPVRLGGTWMTELIAAPAAPRSG
jgi:iron complex transport system substrate-binding protein